MLLREITIGRDRRCDIDLDPKCEFASSHHASVYMDGSQLMYRDKSRNGTMINNISVHNRAVPINYGDIIMIAGRYQLNWSQIQQYFPQNNPQTVVVSQPVCDVPETSDWNWGAFGIYPIWGFFNGCWWAFLVSVFFGWLFPLPNIVFGIYGSRWAWENRAWTNTGEYERTKKSWNVAGIVFTCINVVLIFIVSAFYMSLLSLL